MCSNEVSWGLQEGDSITDDLTAMKLLGGGSAYEAYLAFDEITWSQVVVKVLRPDQVESSSARRGLRREVRALAEINHPVVVRGLRHEYDGQRPHVVLEAVDGPRLSTLIRRYGPLQDAQYLPLAIDLASAAHYLRRVGYVHLDIKPSNIIMGSPARLIDLSVARTVEAAAELGHLIGTDSYMAPEQVTPGDPIAPQPASDVWGIGATLFEAVAGHRAFPEGDPDSDSIEDQFPQLTLAPRELPESVHPTVAKVIEATLNPDPEHRPLPHEISETLEPVLAALPRGHLAGFRLRR